ncbi:hypothetical protein GGI21_003541 [Coemansia aciculifera]|uniref:Uncharacterized protein n=1 Tax=Coemansia aciculifera TaxID=417176 RepID=A0ACC1M5T3_9FUNG|nr:hypothetical protein IWW38_002226 [Coemansia aciculifera]KAJ2907785.1 hypothetical protein GGI21_003541 [Coemansia aciculifera]
MLTPTSIAHSGYGRQPEARQFQRAMLYEEAEDFKRLQRLVFDYDNYIVPLFPRLYKVAPKSTKLAQLQCIPIVGNLFIFWLTSRFIYKSMNFDCLSTSTVAFMMCYSGIMFLVGFVPFLGVWATYKMKPLYTCWTMFSKDINNKGLYHGESASGARAEFPVRDTMRTDMSSICPTNRDIDLIEMPVMTPNPSHQAARSGSPPEKGFYAPSRTPPPPPMYGNKALDSNDYNSFCPVPTGNNQRSTAANHQSEYYDDGLSTRNHSFDGLRASTMPEAADFLKNDYMERDSYINNWPLKN